MAGNSVLNDKKQNTNHDSVQRKSVENVLHENIEKRAKDKQAFFVGDLGEVERQYYQWTKLLPRIRPYYAMKCNPQPEIIKTLSKCGAAVDCASKSEIEMVLSLGIPPNDIIFANPCKQLSHIQFASDNKVKRTTFDNEEELGKIKSIYPDADCVLRILPDDSKSKCRLGIKFGAALVRVPRLLKVAKQLNLNVIGISCHVGSGCYDASAMTDAVKLARQAFDIGQQMGFNFTLFDVGGGFPANGSDGLQFDEIARVLGPTIDELFPPEIEIIAEPGRYFVGSAFTLACSIVSRRVIPRDLASEDTPTMDDHPSIMYYLNDGMYGSFNCLTFDHGQNPKPEPLMRSNQFCYNQLIDDPLYECSLWGPTCDSIDCLGQNISLPEMKIGDWLVFHNMGAYTIAAASTL